MGLGSLLKTKSPRETKSPVSKIKTVKKKSLKKSPDDRNKKKKTKQNKTNPKKQTKTQTLIPTYYLHLDI